MVLKTVLARATVVSYFADVLIEGLIDWVPIDQLIWAVREGVKGRPWNEFFAEPLHFLPESGLIHIGELAAEGFLPWGRRLANLSNWSSMTLSAFLGTQAGQSRLDRQYESGQ
ncbi:hypothetical protein ACFU6I_11110 [Streptomyces sp. NPDC057486]|uniref:hypothetical protein n=1 Tax=Streptomyces sp. NPDC057486 TaxID=3346145 RepID=UPI00368D1C0F